MIPRISLLPLCLAIALMPAHAYAQTAPAPAPISWSTATIKSAALGADRQYFYDSLGDALLAAGDTAGARIQFTKAVELPKKTGHAVGPESARKLEALK